ncbi:MAG: hypothetical protein AABZ33_13215 [Chloroflexota bacterium]
MTRGAGLTGPLLATLGRPRWWALALAGFLVRGGILLMFLPIVTLPTPSGVTNALGPAVTGLALGGAGTDLILLVVGASLALVAAIIVGGLVGAWLEVTLVREVAVDEELGVALPGGPGGPGSGGLVGRGFAVRLLSHIPLVLALIWGVPGIVQAGYAELILPDELVTPLLVRVIQRVPVTVGLIVAAWLLGELLGGLALRELVAGRSLLAALGRGILAVVRRPIGAIGVLVATQAAMAILLVPALSASGATWDRVRFLLVDGILTSQDAVHLVLSLCLFVTLWFGGFVLAGLATAVRAAAWTVWSFALPSAPLPGGPLPGDQDALGAPSGTS